MIKYRKTEKGWKKNKMRTTIVLIASFFFLACGGLVDANQLGQSGQGGSLPEQAGHGGQGGQEESASCQKIVEQHWETASCFGFCFFNEYQFQCLATLIDCDSYRQSAEAIGIKTTDCLDFRGND